MLLRRITKYMRDQNWLAVALQSQLGWATGHYLMLAGANQSAHELPENSQSRLGVAPVPNGGDAP